MYLNCYIGDLGLSQPADVSSQNNEIYGVIPYIAPEGILLAIFEFAQTLQIEAKGYEMVNEKFL
ncbi:4891_t:CDS:2 [Funneliformis geosporum]|uniref:4891_t:CDS:1 n=1 Tax=Funneliformis geosporum TaxID=1117311 RepID=A0A9W4SSU7_9GLOM|nr:4891_t:CDS:2 [Funneliformis geosporum]